MSAPILCNEEALKTITNADPELLRIALKYAKPNALCDAKPSHLEAALTASKPELLKVALQQARDDTLRTALTEADIPLLAIAVTKVLY